MLKFSYQFLSKNSSLDSSGSGSSGNTGVSGTSTSSSSNSSSTGNVTDAAAQHDSEALLGIAIGDDTPSTVSAVPFGPALPNSSSYSSTDAHMAVAVGPFVPVFGEPQGDWEASWRTRADRAFQTLQSLLRFLGADPDTLIPDDSFLTDESQSAKFAGGSNAEVYEIDDDLPPLINAETGTWVDQTSSANTMPITGMKDGMSDEELARYFQNLDHEID